MEPNDLVECYPEIMANATAWCRGNDRRDDGHLAVTDDGLRHLLRLIADMQRALLDGLMVTTDVGGKPSKDGIHLPFKVAAKLLNRTSQVWCEGDLIVSGLFFVDGKPVLSRSTEVPLLGSEPQKENPAPAGEVKP